MKRALKCVALWAAIATAAAPVSAALQLRISDGTPAGTLTIEDQSALDANGTLGVVSYTGPVGLNWALTVNTGTSKPVLGSADHPDIDLNSKEISSTSGGMLTVELTDTDFSGSGPAIVNIGGNTQGSVRLRSYVDYTNAPFGKSTPIADQGPFLPLVYSSSANGQVTSSVPYSITLELQITHVGSGSTGLDAELAVFPPTFTCPTNTSVRCGGSLDPDVNTQLGKPTYIGKPQCLPASITYSDATNVISDCSKIITRTWTIGDACGKTNFCIQEITVFEDVAPVLTVPASTSVECSAIPDVGTATGSDTCDNNVAVVYLGQTRVDGQNPDCAYTIIRTWKATDSCNNSVTNSQTILVRDTTAPMLTVPGPVTVECSAIPAPGTPTATDNCDATPLISYLGQVVNGSGCNYTITRRWKAEDDCGNAVTNRQIITVQDTSAPVINTVPAGGDIGCTALPSNATVKSQVTASDNCGMVTINVSYVDTRTDCATNRVFSITATDGCNTSTVRTVTYTMNCGPCEPPPCGDCEGKVTQLTLRYDGAAPALITVVQKKPATTVFSGTVNPGGLFTFDGVDKMGTLSTEIFISINGVLNTQIHTSCSQPIGPGLVSGAFTVTDGYSKVGGRFCRPSDCQATLCGSVLRDCDADGALSGEAGLGGWTVTLKNAAGSTTLGTTTTDASGNYCFTNLAAATYTVVVTPQEHYTQSFDADGTKDHSTSVTLANCENKSGVKFGYTGSKPGVFIKMTGPSTAKCGDTITYSICVTNTGNTCLYGGMIVNSPLLGGQIFHQTPVNPGQGFCFTKTYVVKNSDVGTLLNTATVIGDPPGSLANVSMSASISTTVTCTPSVCVPSTFNFEGSSALSGTAGNVRTFTVNGVSVKATAFSRIRSSGVWNTAYLGQYSGGLGVTDGSEGNGDSDRHCVDNLDRDNYVLFEFSQPVVLDRAALGYVVGDSDVSVWIGTFANPFLNHLTLSDAVLGDFGFYEEELTTLTGPRTVNLNAGEVTGNAIIIAAQVTDLTPEDRFKIQSFDLCGPSGPSDCQATLCGSVLRDCDADGALSGEAGLGGWTVTLKNAAGSTTLGTTTTDASGNYCFTNLAAATYTVVVTPQEHYTQSFDADGTKDHSTSVTLANCENKSGVKFGYTGSKPGVFIKMTGPSTAKCGDTITYSICVTNTGNTCLYGGMIVNSPLLGGQIFHQTPVNPGQGFCFTKTYVVGANYSGTLANTATVIGDPPGSLPNVSMVVKVNTTVTCTPPTSSGCTLTIGYYKNHSSAIAPLPINLGTAGGAKTLVVSSQTIGVRVLGQHSYGAPANGITKLYAQLLAAKLNVLRGASASAVSSIISAADAFLATHNHLDWGTLTAAEKNNVATWHTTLDKYNNGLIGPGHCGDLECNRALDLECTTGSKSVALSWTRSTEATSYQIMRGLKPEGPYTSIKSGHTTTNYTDTAVTNGVAYYYVVSAVKNGAAITESDEVCATPAVAPVSPWKTQDIGVPDYAGAASVAGGVFTILGGGDDIWNTADEFRYTYQSGSGDCTVIARVTAVGNTDPWAKAGVMIRESLTPGSKHAFMCLTPGNGAAFQSRLATGGTSENVNTIGLVAPYWVAVTRVGHVFTGYTSPNGSTWTKVGQKTIPMSTSVFIGLGVTSHNDGALSTAKFQNVTATP